MPLLLGIDIGTTNSKVIALDGVSGRTVASAAAATPTVRLGPDHIEHDPDELWTVVAGLVRTVVAAATEPAVQNPAVQNPAVQNPAVQKPAEIVGVAISSVGEAGVFLDEHARAVYPIIAWHDTRTSSKKRGGASRSLLHSSSPSLVCRLAIFSPCSSSCGCERISRRHSRA